MPSDLSLRADARRLASIGADRVREDMIYKQLYVGKQHRDALTHILDVDREAALQGVDGVTYPVNRFRRTKNAALVLAGVIAGVGAIYLPAWLDTLSIPRPTFAPPPAPIVAPAPPVEKPKWRILREGKVLREGEVKPD